MKTTIEELRNNNIGYTLGKDGITEADLRLVNGIIDKIEQTRTRKPQPLDVVEYTDSFGCYYPNAIIDGDTYRNDSDAADKHLLERSGPSANGNGRSTGDGSKHIGRRHLRDTLQPIYERAVSCKRRLQADDYGCGRSLKRQKS